jgi:hypothetical protein
LSRGSASDGNALVVEYERFVHLQRPTALRIRMRHGFHSETASIKFNGDFLRRFQLDKVAPQPESVQIGPEWMTYHFKSDAPGELVVRFDLLPEQIGSLSGRVRADDGNQVAFAQFVFP